MHELLRRFDTFADLDNALLSTISRLCSRVRFPAGRWLLRPGRSLNHHHFLLSGKVRTLSPERVVRASRTEARAPLFPGHAGIFTLTDVEMLRIGSSELEFLLESRLPGCGSVDEAGDHWQLRFLRSHMMASLPMSCWQSLLRVLEPRVYEAGADVVVEGMPVRPVTVARAASAESAAPHCYILAAGRAVIHRREGACARLLRRLGPGDFFGEDALLSGRPRNATVTALDRIRVMRLDAADFQRFLLSAMDAESAAAKLPQGQPDSSRYSNIASSLVRIDVATGLRERLESLDPCGSYLLQGDDPGLVALALFLLRQRGIRARQG
ncbi:MAG: cyclic nucleotide-binding domain-containing protein [Pseudomonadales bacterium]|nr:cyclic nucleotide-binding domain-containing protein [Pseudomonadales bacterium]